MKRTALLALALGLVLGISGCGFDTTIDSTVTVVRVTPTPEPTPTPEVTPTPEATPTPVPVYEQSPSGVKVEVKEGTYYAASDLNLRSDCGPEGQIITGVALGTELKSTGVCENGWIRVDYQGQTCYASGDYVSTEPVTAAVQ